VERTAGGENCGKRRHYPFPEHWEVVRFVREFYLEFNTSPAIRMLVKAMANKFGEEKGNSRYLYRLFPKGPAKQATKIAGLPKPVKCI
jgi:tRNA 2-thiouridine synthesizing protein E